MRVATQITAPAPGYLSWWVRSCLNGFALGAAGSYWSWNLPPLYQSGVRFAFEPAHGSGDENFDSPPIVYQRGWGDCDDLVYWRVTELLAAHLPAGQPPTKQQLQRLQRMMVDGRTAQAAADWDGGALHVYVRHANGRKEDPSVILGAPSNG